MREVKGKPHTLCLRSRKNGPPCWLGCRGGGGGAAGNKTGSLQTRIRLVSRDEVQRMGATSVGVCQGSACHFSPTASSPRTSQGSRCNLQSFSGDLAKWKAALAVRGGAEIERSGSDRVSPCIYLPDTLTSAAPAENHPDSSSTTLCTRMLM